MKDSKKNQSASATPEQQASREAASKPSPHDLHEQRQAGQQREAVIREGAKRTQQSQLDLDRAAGEGMTAPSGAEFTETPAAPPTHPGKPAGKPTPGANSTAGQRG